jgi:chromosome transmission fidelity protein 1
VRISFVGLLCKITTILFRAHRVDKSGTKYNQDTQEDIVCTKVFYASRTHSQLSQVLPELSKLKGKTLSITNHHLPQSVPSKRIAEDSDAYVETYTMSTTRTVSLGSRKQLCIHDELRLKTRDLDEACRELLGGMADAL